MKMNKLFDENDRYSKESLEVDKEIRASIKPIFKKWSDLGYSLREISHIASHTILSIESEMILGKKRAKKDE